MLSRAERRLLVEAPLPAVRIIPSVKRWAGVQVQTMDSFFSGLLEYNCGKYSGSGPAAENAIRVMESEANGGERL